MMFKKHVDLFYKITRKCLKKLSMCVNNVFPFNPVLFYIPNKKKKWEIKDELVNAVNSLMQSYFGVYCNYLYTCPPTYICVFLGGADDNCVFPIPAKCLVYDK